MSSTRRYFFCDAPSPLHSAKSESVTKRNAALKEADELAKSVGAENVLVRESGRISGFVFAAPPAVGKPYHWRPAGKTDQGEKYYVPSRRTKEGRQLAEKISKPWFRSDVGAVVHASGMHIMQLSKFHMLETTAGWRDDRIFISVPNTGDGDPFPLVPDYLTECQEWEMMRWFAEGREKVCGGAA